MTLRLALHNDIVESPSSEQQKNSFISNCASNSSEWMSVMGNDYSQMVNESLHLGQAQDSKCKCFILCNITV